MNSAALIALWRTTAVDDAVVPYLWSADEAASYADDAQKMFVRLTGGIRDASSDLCSVDMVAGEAMADIDPRILRIVRIQRNSDAIKLDVININDVDDRGIKLDTTQGVVTRAVVGMSAHSVRWLYIPLVNDTASMVVDRLPLTTITSARAIPLEIDDQHHRHLFLWMNSLAYAKQDADTLDKDKAERNEAQFRAYCAEAANEKARAQHKARSVQYGGL